MDTTHHERNAIPSHRASPGTIALGVVAVFVQTLLLCMVYVAGMSTSSRPEEVVARATWLATLAVVALGIVAIIWSTARGRRWPILVPVGSIALVVVSALAGGWLFTVTQA